MDRGRIPTSASDVSPSRTPLLDVRDLHTHFTLRNTTIYAVDGVSFHVAAGECLGLVGESGSGKSVTALSIMRLLGRSGHITSEAVYFHGYNLLQLKEAEFRKLRGHKIAMVPQNPMASLNPVLTIGDHLRELYHVHLGFSKAVADERSIALLQQVGLSDPTQRLREYPHRLSGGQRQRVMIALAVACGPELLIADEPTTALDVTIQAQILDLLQNLTCESQLATILITHNLGIVAGMCDRVVVMYAGRVVESAPVYELFQRPRHPYTVGLLRCVPRILPHRNRVFPTIPGSPPVITQPVSGCPFVARCQYATEQCRAAMPPLEPMGTQQHVAACWHPVESTVIAEMAQS